MISGNWVAVRRGILRHLEEGLISGMEFSIYMAMLIGADKANGAWRGSAAKLAEKYHYAENTAYHVLQLLEKKGYIKRLWKKGQKGNYWIVINRYPITFGPFEGRLVDAAGTTDHQKPALIPDGSEQDDEEEFSPPPDDEGREEDERAR